MAAQMIPRENGREEGETAPFCPIEGTVAKKLRLTHESREAAWARKLAARLQETLNRNQNTAEAGGKRPKSPAYGKPNDDRFI